MTLLDETLRVHLCCNDPDNGCFTGQLHSIDINGNLTLTSNFLHWAPRLRYLDDKISIARKHFPVIDRRSHVGNWCWDGVSMCGSVVLELLNWLMLKDWYSPEEGETRLFSKWQNKREYTEPWLRVMLKNVD